MQEIHHVQQQAEQAVKSLEVEVHLVEKKVEQVEKEGLCGCLLALLK